MSVAGGFSLDVANESVEQGVSDGRRLYSSCYGSCDDDEQGESCDSCGDSSCDYYISCDRIRRGSCDDACNSGCNKPCPSGSYLRGATFSCGPGCDTSGACSADGTPYCRGYPSPPPSPPPAPPPRQDALVGGITSIVITVFLIIMVLIAIWVVSKKQPKWLAGRMMCSGIFLIVMGSLGGLSPTGALWAFVLGIQLVCANNGTKLAKQACCIRAIAIIGIVFSAVTMIALPIVGPFYERWVNYCEYYYRYKYYGYGYDYTYYYGRYCAPLRAFNWLIILYAVIPHAIYIILFTYVLFRYCPLGIHVSSLPPPR